MPRELPASGEVEAAGSDFDGVRRQASHLDALARGWRKALESAHSALRVAGPYLSGNELGERRDRLAKERSNVARLLESLARDLQADSIFVRGLNEPTSL